MVRRLIVAFGAPMLAVLLAVTASGASAAETPSSSPPPPAICAEGELAAHNPRQSTNGRFVAVDLTGWIKACADADPDEVSRAKLTWAGYYGNYALPSSMEAFPAGFERVELARELRIGNTRLIDWIPGRMWAFCMVTGSQTRIACLRIGRVDSAGLPEVTPIPTDHPSVRHPVPFGGPVRPPNPECPTCVGNV